MFKHVILYLAIFAAFLAETPVLHAQLKTSEKAGWIVNIIAPSTNWKNEAGISEYTIGVYGLNEIYNELLKLSETIPIKGKKFTVINFKRIKDILPTNILYVAIIEIERMPDIVNKLGVNTLFITDNYTGRDYMINFLEKNTNNRNIDIEPKIAEKAGITFEDKLLVFTGKGDIIRTIYTKTERQLKEEKLKLEQQKIELEAQKNELYKLRRENIKERAEIEKQKDLNEKQKKDKENQKYQIDQQRIRLDEVQKKPLKSDGSFKQKHQLFKTPGTKN